VPLTSTVQFQASNRGLNQVAIVAPGLNNRPEAMQPLMATLNAHGYDCVCVRLAFGQRLSSDEIASEWVAALASAYDACHERYAEGRVHSVAYSLGGLVTLTFLQRTPAAAFERVFLIAPPLALTATGRLVSYLTPLRRLGLGLPSLAPRSIRERSFTTFADYHAMLLLVSELNRLSVADNVRRTRGRIIVDAADELVDASGVADWVRRQKLDWKVRVLEDCLTNPRPRHLLLSEASMGSDAWRLLTGEMLGHLISPSPPLS
jgi:pimeloyl-ACP methyl ester carboxylesterase